MDDYRQRLNEWLESPYFDEASKQEIRAIRDEKELQERFYKNLNFGTGGLRGIMGAGPNRVNKYTVRRITQGLAEYLKAEFDAAQLDRGVVVAYDTRNHSREYAHEAIGVLCANGVKALAFSQATATPLLSFAAPHLNALAGIVITASHNPKEYNGYKIYDHTGCQLTPRGAKKLREYIDLIEDYSCIETQTCSDAEANGMLRWLKQDVQNAFLQEIKKQSLYDDAAAKSALRIAYTPLHGTGLTPVTQLLKETGFSNVCIVEEQESEDGDFPTVSSPNPEDPAAFEQALALGEKKISDIILGTDPDSDRIGVWVRHDGRYHSLNGNQLGALLVDYMATKQSKKRTLYRDAQLIKTIVTNEMGAAIARSFGIQTIDTLTGFKYIGEQVNRLEKASAGSFFFGYEESYGFLTGLHARDKDAVSACMLLCEMAAEYKAGGFTLLDRLEQLFKRFGYYVDAQETHAFPGADGAAQMEEILHALRADSQPLCDPGEKRRDYNEGLDGLPCENVLKYTFNNNWVAIRPSGTEPKLKLYYSICRDSQSEARECLAKLQQTVKERINVK